MRELPSPLPDGTVFDEWGVATMTVGGLAVADAIAQVKDGHRGCVSVRAVGDIGPEFCTFGVQSRAHIVVVQPWWVYPQVAMAQADEAAAQGQWVRTHVPGGVRNLLV